MKKILFLAAFISFVLVSVTSMAQVGRDPRERVVVVKHHHRHHLHHSRHHKREMVVVRRRA